MLTGAERTQVDNLTALLREVLGENVVGAYLFGSAVLGGLKPSSDLDVLAVVTRATTDDEKRRLVNRLLQQSGHPRRLELTFVVQSAIKPWHYPPSMDFQYGDWLRAEFERGNLEPWPSRVNPDVATLITMVLLADAPLLGPPPADVFAAVPHEDLMRAMTVADDLVADAGSDTRNVVLTLARMWSTLETGAVRSKDAAADWALERLALEHRPVLGHARAIYLGEQDEAWDDELARGVRPYVEAVVREIERHKD